MSHVVLNEKGYPVLLADVPGSGVGRVDPNAASGNPRHDTRSGKFSAGGKGKKRPTAPANVDPADFARMRDAVREAAREFQGELTPENLQSFIARRAANPNAVNIAQFMQLVQQQQIDDLIDVLEGKSHGGVKVSAPRSYVKKVLAGLSDDDVSEIFARLKARGIKNPHLKVGRALPRERRDAVAALQEET